MRHEAIPEYNLIGGPSPNEGASAMFCNLTSEVHRTLPYSNSLNADGTAVAFVLVDCILLVVVQCQLRRRRPLAIDRRRCVPRDVDIVRKNGPGDVGLGVREDLAENRIDGDGDGDCSGLKQIMVRTKALGTDDPTK
jgi:hypothetical protein